MVVRALRSPSSSHSGFEKRPARDRLLDRLTKPHAFPGHPEADTARRISLGCSGPAADGERATRLSPFANHQSPLIAVAEGVGKAAVSMARAIPCAAHGFFQDFDKSFGLWRPGLRECTAGPFAASFSLSFLRGFGATDRVDDWTVMPIFFVGREGY